MLYRQNLPLKILHLSHFMILKLMQFCRSVRFWIRWKIELELAALRLILRGQKKFTPQKSRVLRKRLFETMATLKCESVYLGMSGINYYVHCCSTPIQISIVVAWFLLCFVFFFSRTCSAPYEHTIRGPLLVVVVNILIVVLFLWRTMFLLLFKFLVEFAS